MNSQMLDSTFFFTEEECQQILRELEADVNNEGVSAGADYHASFNFNSAPYHIIDPELRRDGIPEVPFTYASFPETLSASDHQSDWLSLASYPPTSMPTSMTSEDAFTYDSATWESLAPHSAIPTTEPLPQLPFDKSTAMETIAQMPYDVATGMPKEPRSATRSKFSRPALNSGMRRHTVDSAPVPSVPLKDGSETPPATQSTQGLRQQRNHYVIERRYRTNLNEKLRELDEVVPEVVPDINTELIAETQNASPESSSSGPGSSNNTQGSAQSSYSSIKMSPTMTNASTGKRSARKSHVLDRTLWYIRYLENRIQHSDDKLHTMKKSIKLSLDVLMRGGESAGVGAVLSSELMQKSLDDIPENDTEVQDAPQDSAWSNEAMKQ